MLAILGILLGKIILAARHDTTAHEHRIPPVKIPGMNAEHVMPDVFKSL